MSHHVTEIPMRRNCDLCFDQTGPEAIPATWSGLVGCGNVKTLTRLGRFFLTAIHSVENLRIASVSPPFIVTRRQPWASCFGPTRTSNQSGLWIQKPGRTMIHPKDPSRQCKVGSSCVEAFFCTQNLIARLIFWFFLNILKHVGHVGLRFDDKPQMLLIAWSWCMTSPPGCAGFRLQASHSSSWVHEDILSGHFTPIASKMFTRIRQRRAWRAAASTWICFYMLSPKLVVTCKEFCLVTPCAEAVRRSIGMMPGSKPRQMRQVQARVTSPSCSRWCSVQQGL